MDTNSLRLLHLSDIHFKKLDFDIDSDLRNQLEKDAKKLKGKGGAIQGILVTGDVAFSGRLEEYEVALNWLEKLCRQVNCPPANVWSIPGNHDVDRSKIEGSKLLRSMHTELRSSTADDLDHLLEEYFTDISARPLMYESIQNYIRGFASKFNCELNVEQPFIEQNLKLNDGSILKIRGVNSTLISDINDAEKKMVVGSRQANISAEDGVEYLLMCHHPYSWLLDEDDRRQHWLARARIHLFGHKHNQHLERVNDSLVMTAGAMHPSRREPNWIPRYNMLEIRASKNDEQRYLEVNVYPRIWSKDDQAFQADFSGDGKEFRDYKLPIPNWVGEDAMKETSAPHTEIVSVAVDTVSPKKEALLANPIDPARELTYKFLRLPFHTRISIANKLDLLQDEDEGLQEGDLFQSFFRSAKQNNKLKELWEEVERAHGNKDFSHNPYQQLQGGAQ